MLDPYLYHYTPLETALELILPSRNLRLGPLQRTKDPRENSTWRFGSVGSGREPRDFDADWNATHLPPDSFLRRGLLAACFCERFDGSPVEPFIEGYARPRMWAQYGASHRGVCLVFDRRTFLVRLESSLRSSEFLYAEPVRYTGIHDPGGRHGISHEDIEGAHIIDMDRVEKFGLEQALNEHRQRYFNELFFSKHQDWRDEWEFRFIVHSQERNELFVDIQDILLEAVLGVDFPQIYEPCLSSICASLSIKASRLRWRNGLRAVKIDVI